ncbi:MAG: alcohol dehydrogenase catalytic domain-containing protein [Acidimicrobiales bacterium]
MTTDGAHPRRERSWRHSHSGPGQTSEEDIANPAICLTDLHTRKADVPDATSGRLLGHERIRVIAHVGSGVAPLQVGDRVILWCVASCCRTTRAGTAPTTVRGPATAWIPGGFPAPGSSTIT